MGVQSRLPGQGHGGVDGGVGGRLKEDQLGHPQPEDVLDPRRLGRQRGAIQAVFDQPVHLAQPAQGGTDQPAGKGAIPVIQAVRLEGLVQGKPATQHAAERVESYHAGRGQGSSSSVDRPCGDPQLFIIQQ
jgi:hypothetical protein